MGRKKSLLKRFCFVVIVFFIFCGIKSVNCE